MYDGALDPLDPVDPYLEGETDYVPGTQQDEMPHKDGLFGRNYQAEFREEQVGDNAIAVTEDGDHYDVIVEDPETGNMYHDRIQKT